MQRIGFLIAAVMAVLVSCAPLARSAPDNTADAAAIHHQGFVQELAASQTDPWAKYGLYSARLIAVKHPEVYLQGDLAFAEYITTQPGYARAYREGPASMYLYRFDELAPDGTPFSFGLVDFNQFQIVSLTELYGAAEPVYNFLDERLTALHTTLKTGTITSLEGAGLVYVKKRMEGNPSDQTYLILTQNKAGFVYSQGHFYDCLGRPAEPTAIEDPVLIFNEQAVWYPLMDRDDTATAPVLRSLVQSLASAKRTPALSSAEQRFAAQLKTASDLDTPAKKRLAAVFATHYADFPRFSIPMSVTVSREMPEVTNQRTLLFLNALILKHGNYLSPHSAALAAMLGKEPLQNLKQFETAYLARVGCEKIFANGVKEDSAWGHTWPCTLNENNIDDAFRTRGGHCISQSANISAVLDLANQPNVHLNYLSLQDPSHSIVIVPAGNWIFDNGRLFAKEKYRRQSRMVEVGIVQNQLLVMGKTGAVYVTGPHSDAPALHQSLENLAQTALDNRLLIPSSAKSLVYKTF